MSSLEYGIAGEVKGPSNKERFVEGPPSLTLWLSSGSASVSVNGTHILSTASIVPALVFTGVFKGKSYDCLRGECKREYRTFLLRCAYTSTSVTESSFSSSVDMTIDWTRSYLGRKARIPQSGEKRCKCR